MAKFKKLALISSAVLMTTSFALGLAACDDQHVHSYATTVSKDATHHWYACTGEECTEVFAKNEHVWVAGEVTTAPTETTKGAQTYSCAVCGETKTVELAELAHTHVAAEAWQSDDNKHWKACTNEACTEVKLEEADHNWDKGEETTAATEDAEGVMTYTCEDCGKEKTEPIAKLAHVHTFETTLSKDATNHWYACEDDDCNVTVGKVAHIWDKGDVSVSPTEETEGTIVYTCVVCGYEKEDSIDKLTPDPLRVAKGTVELTAKDYEREDNPDTEDVDESTKSFGGDNYADGLVINFTKAGVYVVKTDNESIADQTLDVAEAGEQTVCFEIFDFSAPYTVGDVIKVNYTVTEVPVVTPTEMEGEVEMTANTNVKISFTAPTAGRYTLTTDDSVALKADPSDGGEKGFYYFETTADGETVTLWATVESDDEKATVAYTLTQLTATEVYEGNNTVNLVSGTFTEVAFTLPATKEYKISTYTDYITYSADTSWTPLTSIGDWSILSGEAGEVVSFYIYSFSANTESFNISELTDEEKYPSDIVVTSEESEVLIKAGSSTTATLDITEAGTYVIEWSDINGGVMQAGYGSIQMTVGTQNFNMTAPFTAYHPLTGMEITLYKGVVALWADADTTVTFTNLDSDNDATLKVMYQQQINTYSEFDVYVQQGLTMPGLTLSYSPGYEFQEKSYTLTWDTPLTVYKDQTTSSSDGTTGFTFDGINAMNWLTAYVPSVDGANAYGHFVVAKKQAEALETKTYTKDIPAYTGSVQLTLTVAEAGTYSFTFGEDANTEWCYVFVNDVYSDPVADLTNVTLAVGDTVYINLQGVYTEDSTVTCTIAKVNA